MSRDVNKVILVGNLGADPETRYTGSGTAVTSARIATSESWKDKQTGEQQERSEWHSLTFFGRLAEVAGEYLKKGSQVYIEGRLRTEEWEKDGVKRYTTKIVVDEMQMLGGRQEGGSRGRGEQRDMYDGNGRDSEGRSEGERRQAQQRSSANNHGSTRGEARQQSSVDDDTIPF